MNPTQTREQELFEKIFNLQTEIENPSTEYFARIDAQSELVELNYEYTELQKVECIATNQHFRHNTSVGGNDVCFNCGATN